MLWYTFDKDIDAFSLILLQILQIMKRLVFLSFCQSVVTQASTPCLIIVYRGNHAILFHGRNHYNRSMCPHFKRKVKSNLIVLLLYCTTSFQICLQFSIVSINGHGRLRKPPSRASMWRDGYPTPPDYNDNQGYCGGFGVIFWNLQSSFDNAEKIQAKYF